MLLHDLSDCKVDFDADMVLKLLNNDDCDQAEKKYLCRNGRGVEKKCVVCKP